MRKYGTAFDPADIHFRALDKPFFFTGRYPEMRPACDLLFASVPLPVFAGQHSS